jgi:hypothetical protein
VDASDVHTCPHGLVDVLDKLRRVLATRPRALVEQDKHVVTISRLEVLEPAGKCERGTRLLALVNSNTLLSLSSSANSVAPALNSEQKRWYVRPMSGGGRYTARLRARPGSEARTEGARIRA